MKKFALTVFFILIQILAFGQHILKTDIDNDGVTDSVYIDTIQSKIICKLSTNNFKPISSLAIEILNEMSGIRETSNGFEFFNNWMRAGYQCQFRYNSKTKKIQLIGMSRYEFGNATNDGSGESSVNLLNGDYIGDWNYYDSFANNEEGELIKIPTIKTKMKFDIINLQDFDDGVYFGYSGTCAELFHKYKKIQIKKNR